MLAYKQIQCTRYGNGRKLNIHTELIEKTDLNQKLNLFLTKYLHCIYFHFIVHFERKNKIDKQLSFIFNTGFVVLHVLFLLLWFDLSYYRISKLPSLFKIAYFSLSRNIGQNIW